LVLVVLLDFYQKKQEEKLVNDVKYHTKIDLIIIVKVAERNMITTIVVCSILASIMGDV
jgi:hypothetical protein